MVLNMQKLDAINNITQVYDWLCDDLSKAIFLNKVSYEVSKDFKYICNIWDLCCPQGLLRNKDKERLKSVRGKNIIIYGAGGGGTYMAFALRDMDIPIKHFWDCNHGNFENGLLGLPVLPPGSGFDHEKDFIVISVLSDIHKSEMKKQLYELKIAEKNVNEHFTGIFHDIYATINKGQYFEEGIVSFGEDEVFLDCGSYDFANSKTFLEKCKNYKRIYAFEPLPTDLLRQEISEYGSDDIRLIEACVYDDNGEIGFEVDTVNSHSSYISESAQNRIKTVKIDDVVDDGIKVTFIKMDIEGAELKALHGASRVIAANKPKLAISIYHKPEDLTEIPFFIKSLVTEYRFFIRHYSHAKWETVLYAIANEMRQPFDE